MNGSNRIWITLLCSSLVICAHSQQAKLVSVPPAELETVKQKLDIGLMPHDAHPPNIIDEKQVFGLVGSSVHLTIVPVSFEIQVADTDSGSANKTDCGIFLIPATGTSTFVLTTGRIDYEAGLTECEGVDAIGIHRTPGGNPVLIVIFKGRNLHEDFSDPYVLTWDKDTKTYRLDEKLASSIAAHVNVFTVANIKRFLDQISK